MLKLEFKDNVHAAVDLDRPKLSIGRHPDNDVVLAEDGVSSRHAKIEQENDQLLLYELGSKNGTFVNDQRITGMQALKAWDIIRFDTVTAEVIDTDSVRPTRVGKAISDADLAAHQQKAAQWSLKGTTDPVNGKVFAISGKTVAGRDEDCAISIPVDTVSGRHAEFYLKDNQLHLRDLDSTNGSFVNGQRVTDTALRAGDTVKLDTTEFRVKGPAGAAQKTQVRQAVAPAAGTAVRPAVDTGSAEPAGGATRTSINQAATQTGTAQAATAKSPLRRIPAWAYGLAGFIIVAGVLAAILLFVAGGGSNSSGPVAHQPQGFETWTQMLSAGRKGATTPVLTDINGDQYLDVIVADAGGYVTALDGAEGKRIFETEVIDRILAAPVAGDLTGDKIDDVVVASNAGVVAAVNGKGQILWKSPSDLNTGEIINRPVLADVNNDGTPDVIVPTARLGLTALDGARGWEIWNSGGLFSGGVVTSPVVADVNGDGLTDFVAATSSGQVVAVTSQKGKAWELWSTQVGPIYYASPLYLEIDDQGIIVVATDKQGIIALNAETGRMYWNAGVEKRFFASPVAARANDDDVPDVIATALNGDIHVLDGTTGEEIWSVAVGANIQATPVLFDINDDGLDDLILPGLDSVMRVIDMARGREILSIDLSGSGGCIASPVLGDVNNDGLLDVITAGQSGQIAVHGLNRQVKKGQAVWPVFLGNDRHGQIK